MKTLYKNVVFAYSGDSYFVSGGNTYLRDYGPNGFHMRFAAGSAAPALQLDGSLYFLGVNYCYFDGDLARYYARMPTGAHTWLARFMQTFPGNHVLYGCDNGGAPWKGIFFGTNATTTAFEYQMQGTIATPNFSVTYKQPGYTNRSFCMTVEAIPRAFDQCTPATPDPLGAWSAPFGTAVYDITQAPRIGMRPNTAWPYIGHLYYLALIDGAITTPELLDLSHMIREGEHPFCNWR